MKLVRRAVAVVVMAAALAVGSAVSADAGEWCVRVAPRTDGLSPVKVCIPTNL